MVDKYTLIKRICEGYGLSKLPRDFEQTCCYCQQKSRGNFYTTKTLPDGSENVEKFSKMMDEARTEAYCSRCVISCWGGDLEQWN